MNCHFSGGLVVSDRNSRLTTAYYPHSGTSYSVVNWPEWAWVMVGCCHGLEEFDVIRLRSCVKIVEQVTECRVAAVACV